MNKTPSSISELEQIIADYPDRLRTIQTELWEPKPAPGKWSKKEILGHLIDSAHNNFDRLVRSQSVAQNIVYDQDRWVAVQKYQERDFKDLIDEWTFMNQRLIRIAGSIESYDKPIPVGKDIWTLKELIDDYVRHLMHHMRQITMGTNLE